MTKVTIINILTAIIILALCSCSLCALVLF